MLNWTEEKLKLLKEQWYDTKLTDLVSLLNCSTTSICRKASELGLPSKSDLRNSRWTKEVDNIIIGNWKSKTLQEISNIINKENITKLSVRNRGIQLGLGNKANIHQFNFKDCPAIYKINFNSSNKFYIGMTCKSLRRRFIAHLNELRTNTHRNIKLQNEFDKYGENAIQCEIIQELEPHTAHYKALEIESFWINKLNPELNILKHKYGEIK